MYNPGHHPESWLSTRTPAREFLGTGSQSHPEIREFAIPFPLETVARGLAKASNGSPAECDAGASVIADHWQPYRIVELP